MTPSREIPTGGHPHQANSAVVDFLNAFGWAIRDEERKAVADAKRAADELTRLTDEMGLYRTDQEAS